ncbi:hypothetical protein RIF29_17584 [Crotalaria pallida]|uniref:Uncharacterized protein n=1 Tax=Crotalaria pallida TaxID=3830 RepID=A0AAN9IGK3_CROPI
MSATPKPEPEKLKKLEEECRVRVRVPLSQVVADCTNRWFIDTLKAATAGDPSMQLLLSQMVDLPPLSHFKAHFVIHGNETEIDFREAVCETGLQDAGLYRNILVKFQECLGNAWINKASRSRNSVWKASEAHLGYRTSDSDSNELENKTIS